ncbi:MAG: Phosphoribosyl 1 [Candidatus Alkanophagales archaeon MCA70_species_1]|nr:Phosphoribosyl 1 [Candidatus Alkanophaga volatiphilum]
MRGKSDQVKFLGTAGARFVMMRQLRSSAGTWLSLGGTNVLIDPGPGTLVRCATSRPKLNPTTLDAIILSHKHLDHANDVNVMIEAMTEGGFKKRGMLLCPSDAISGDDPVVMKYLRSYLDEIKVFEEGGSYNVGNLKISTPKRHVHGVETYGLEFSLRGRSEPLISFITDTKYFEGLEDVYNGRILVINVVRYEMREGVDHLCVKDVEKIIKARQPELAILTHFGMTMLRNKPHEIARKLSERTGANVIAAHDGMLLDLTPYF